MGEKRLFISDVHIGAGKTGQGSHNYPYAWDRLSDEETDNFSDFLRFLGNEYKDKVKEIVLLGDIFDNWVVPFDIVPPLIEDIMIAPKNQILIKELKNLSEKLPVFYIPGNHDMGATAGVMKKHFPKIIYCPEQYVSGRLIAEHGHRYALFNAPAYFSGNYFGLPLGYFISRVEATRKGMTNEDDRTYHTYVDDFLEVFGSATLPQCVFEAVLEEAGLSEESTFQVKMKGGQINTVTAKEVKERYKNICMDWPSRVISSQRALMAEINFLGPIADRLCKNGKAKVCVFGHSHKVAIDKDTLFVDDRIYANAGYWCGSKCTFVTVEKKRSKKYNVELIKWSGNSNLEKLDQKSVL